MALEPDAPGDVRAPHKADIRIIRKTHQAFTLPGRSGEVQAIWRRPPGAQQTPWMHGSKKDRAVPRVVPFARRRGNFGNFVMPFSVLWKAWHRSLHSWISACRLSDKTPPFCCRLPGSVRPLLSGRAALCIDSLYSFVRIAWEWPLACL